jgi:ABC-type cobalamin transport system ATPase subunit
MSRLKVSLQRGAYQPDRSRALALLKRRPRQHASVLGIGVHQGIGRNKLLKSISRDRATIIMDHDMDALFELAERVTVLQEGRVLIEGTSEEIKKSAAVQEAYLGGMQGVLGA